MNPLAILAAALRAQAVYIVDPKAAQTAFEGLGMTFLGQYQDATHQGVVSKDAKGQYYVTIAGSRGASGYGADLLIDLWLAPVHAVNGGQVASGVYSGMDKFWAWALDLIPPTAPINMEGHSLGAERVLLAPLFIPKSRLGDMHAFEAPMCADQDYWDAYRDELSHVVHTVQGADRWFAYPPRQGYCHDAQANVLWFLSNNKIQSITPKNWITTAFSDADHSIDTLVQRIQTGVANAAFPLQ
jgi:hypothetical protein